MSWRRRASAVAVLVASVAALAQPSPPRAEANVVCDLGSGPAGEVTGGVEAVTGGAVGLGNPLGDACDEVSGALTGAATAPLDAAFEGIGDSVFNQLTSWVAEGATWLIGRVVDSIEKTTTPQVASKSFLSQYMKMAAIATVMAVAMLLLAVLEGLAQGNSQLLVRGALVNAPLAMIATTVAYAVVQLLLVVTDGLCAVISASSDNGSQRFFETAIRGLGQAGGSVGKEVGAVGGPGGDLAGQAGGAAAVPLFVAFLAAIVGAFAAFFVWLEMLARDAAVYVVSLFLPLSLAASIWPRWMGALRKTAELLVAIIASKFVIVAIVGLAAALVIGGDGGIEHVLAASALMLLACFAPFVLIKLIPFAEGAIGAAYSRRSASGGAVSGIQMASDVAILRGMVAARRGDSGVSLWGSGGDAGGGGSPPFAGGSGGKGGGGKGGAPGGGGLPASSGSSAGGSAASAGAGAGAAGGAAGAGAAAAVPAAVGRGARGASARMSQTGAASQAQDAGGASPPGGETSRQAGASEAGSSPSVGERPPRPRSDPPPTKQPGKGSS